VVAVYRESRDGSGDGVLVVDVRWDAPLPSERPRGPLSLGIPVERIGTWGWGWVDELGLPASTRAEPNAAIDTGDPLALALPERFGNAVRRFRTLQGLSQERLSTACGLHRTFIGAVERGETNVSLATLVRLAKGLDVSVSHLVGEAESAHDER
jgi:DNA-binding XRE family transcriptional regulator